jgi:hypothetical protein
VSAEDYKAIGQGNVSQFGTWSVSDDGKTLTQHVDSSFFGRSDGTDVKSSISLTGDELKITDAAGTETWKRPARTLKQQLLPGSWHLVSCDNASQPVCANPRGRVSFDESHYVVVLAAKDRPKVAKANDGPAAITAEEYKAIASGVIASQGTWVVNEAEKTWTLRTEDGLIPNFDGVEYKATIVSLEGDDLKIKGSVLGNSVWHRDW